MVVKNENENDKNNGSILNFKKYKYKTNGVKK